MVDIQTASIVIAATGVFIAAINSIVSRRREEKTAQLTLETRQAQLFMNVYNRWNTPDIQTAYGNLRHIYQFTDFKDFIQKYSIRPPLGSPQNFNSWLNYQILLTYFEGLGMLVKHGLFNIELVEDLLSRRITWFWETYPGQYIEEGRKELKDPTMYDSLEYLYHEMKKRQQPATSST